MEPGIYSGIPADVYHADALGLEAPALSASIATILMRESPLHAYTCHPRLGNCPPREAEIFDLGTAAHRAILEGTEAGYVVVDADDWRTKAAREARDLARANGLIPILARQQTAIRAMTAAIRRQLDAFTDPPRPLTAGKPEQTIVWQDEGIWCKARIDWLHADRRTIDDLKTIGGSARPDAWTRALYAAGKDLQAAFYCRGIAALTGIEPDFRFVVAENAEPYATAVLALGPEALAHAHDQVEQAIQRWARCLETDTWPGYPSRTCYVDPPAWAIASWLEARETPAIGTWERS